MYAYAMGNRTLYVASGAEAVWERAEAVAAGRGVSLSAFVTEALREHLGDPGGGNAMEERLAIVERKIGELGRHTGLDRISAGYDD